MWVVSGEWGSADCFIIIRPNPYLQAKQQQKVTRNHCDSRWWHCDRYFTQSLYILLHSSWSAIPLHLPEKIQWCVMFWILGIWSVWSKMLATINLNGCHNKINLNGCQNGKLCNKLLFKHAIKGGQSHKWIVYGQFRGLGMRKYTKIRKSKQIVLFCFGFS